jgi:hypothetical protein
LTGQGPEVLPSEGPAELDIIAGGSSGCGGPECQGDEDRQESDTEKKFSHGSPSILPISFVFADEQSIAQYLVAATGGGEID